VKFPDDNASQLCEKASGSWRSVQWRNRLWRRVASDGLSDFLTSSKGKRRAGLPLVPLSSRFWLYFWRGSRRTIVLAIASVLSIAQVSCAENPLPALLRSGPPVDPCMRREMTSPGAISYLNARLGNTDGPRSPVAAIQGLRAVPNTPIGGGSTVACYGTLVMTDGTTDAGILSVTDPGGATPLEVSWESDASRVRPDPPQVAAAAPQATQGPQAVTQAVDNVRTKATPILVSKNPRIHCEVLGASEKLMTMEEGKRACEAAVKAASLSEESDRVDHVEIQIHSGVFGYDLYIHYRKDGFSGVWAGREVAIAYGDDYHLAREFVKQLVKISRDPSTAPNQKYVGACGEEDGFTTITGKPGIKLLGCAQYDPYKDAVDPDYKRPAGQ
jgi:hypothetical protein